MLQRCGPGVLSANLLLTPQHPHFLSDVTDETNPDIGGRECTPVPCTCTGSDGKGGGLGRKRCAEAKTINGWETREKRRVWAEKLMELKELEGLLKLTGLLV